MSLNFRAVFKILALGAGALALTSCAKQEGVLTPQATTPGVSMVDMLVATTRAPEMTKPGVLFSGERARGLAFADISVSIPPEGAHVVGEIQWPTQLPADPRRDFTTTRADILDLKGAISRFDARVRRSPDRRVLVFVHGYNTRFEKAVYRLAQISHDSRAPAVPVLFTWPSRGKTLAYPYDRESAQYSRDALERLLQALVDDKEVREVAILAHSMGAMTTMEALRQMAIRHGALPKKIRDVMLASPDIDYDVFRRQIAEIGANHAPFTLLVSRDDKALSVSKAFWGGENRVGGIDPTQEPYRSDLAKDNVYTLDVTDVASTGLGHSKFAHSPELVRAIGARIAGGQQWGEDAGVLGAIGGVAATAGAALGEVATAPFR